MFNFLKTYKKSHIIKNDLQEYDIKYNFPLSYLNLINKDIEQINKNLEEEYKKQIKNLKSTIDVMLLLEFKDCYYEFISDHIGVNYLELIYDIQDDHIKDKINELSLNINDVMSDETKMHVELYYDQDLNKDLVRFNMKYRYDRLFIIDPIKLFNQAFENHYKNSFKSIIGMNNYNQSVIADFKMRPNILISGQTGRGKSNIGNQLLLSLMGQYSSKELDILIFDETRVEFYTYQLSDYVSHHIVEYDDLFERLHQLNTESNRRLNKLHKYNVTNIDQYNDIMNQDHKNLMKRIVIYIDECMNLSKESIQLIKQISKQGQFTGIHFIISSMQTSTQNSNIIDLMDDENYHYLLFKGLHHYLFNGEYDDLFNNLNIHEFVYYYLNENNQPVFERCRGCYMSMKSIDKITAYLHHKED